MLDCFVYFEIWRYLSKLSFISLGLDFAGYCSAFCEVGLVVVVFGSVARLCLNLLAR